MTRIFVSYSRVDQKFALRLKESLEKIGIDVWLDLEDIEPGIKWSTAIQNGLIQSDLMVLILSPESVASQNVEDEWQYFLDERKPIVPVYWRECRPHFQISRLQYIDFRQGITAYDEAFNRLLSVLKSKGINLNKSSELMTKPDESIHTIPKGGFRRGTRWWQTIGAIIGIIVLVLAVYSFVLNGEGDNEQPTPTDTAASTLTPTLSETEVEATVMAQMGQIQTEAAQTIIAQETGTAATATGFAQMTETATQYTFTPAPDARKTAEARLTQTQAAVNPTVTPALTEEEKIFKLAEVGVSSNEEWTPYSEELNGVEMMLVPAGCFMMGSENREEDEKPVHDQCFDAPFWIDRTEVTRAMYQECVDEGVCTETPDNNYSTSERQPINRVTWFQARDYCEWRGERLPTEREWEYAARGPDNLVYPWGNEFVADNVVYGDNSGNVAAEVGSRSGGISWVGTLDMSGNVWEWVSSIYDLYPYSEERESDIDTRSARGLRGGSFLYLEYNLRASSRNKDDPDDQYFNIGFRCARDYE